MAETPTNPTAEELQATGNAAENAAASMEHMYQATTNNKNLFDSMFGVMRGFANSLGNQAEASSRTATMFNSLGLAVLGAKNHFDSFQGIDTKSLNTYTSQMKEFQQTLDNSPFLSTAERAKKLGEQLLGMGANQSTISEISKLGVDALKQYALSFATAADNSQKLQNAYLQLGAASGDLGVIESVAGDRYQNLNLLVEKQAKVIDEAKNATGLTTEVVAEYYSQLGKIPGALQNNIRLTTDNRNTNMDLAQSILVAKGANRDYASVIQDIAIAQKDYNIYGEDALKFSLRISEISKNTGTNLDDVQKALQGTAGNFRMFGNAAESAARLYNEYLGALQKTGISGSVALDVVGGMVNSIKDLDIAQKSFLSAQSGGAGGLMGAFQIEKQLREGKIDEVFDKVRKTMGKQFGEIVSLDEAAGSQQAAAQLTKQIQLLKAGPLGSFAKDDQSAIRLLEAFRMRDRGEAVPTELRDNIIKETADKGQALQGETNTILNEGNRLLDSIRINTDIWAGRVAKENFIAPNVEERMSLANVRERDVVSRTDNQIKDHLLVNQSGEYTANLIRLAPEVLEGVKDSAINMFSNIEKLVMGGDNQAAIIALDKKRRELSQSREEAINISDETARNTRLAEINTEENSLLNQIKSKSNENSIMETLMTPLLSRFQENQTNNSNTTTNNPNTAPTNIITTANTNLGTNNLGEITIHNVMEAVCINCQQKIRNQSQTLTLNPAINSPQGLAK